MPLALKVWLGPAASASPGYLLEWEFSSSTPDLLNQKFQSFNKLSRGCRSSLKYGNHRVPSAQTASAYTPRAHGICRFPFMLASNLRYGPMATPRSWQTAGNTCHVSRALLRVNPQPSADCPAQRPANFLGRQALSWFISLVVVEDQMGFSPSLFPWPPGERITDNGCWSGILAGAWKLSLAKCRANAFGGSELIGKQACFSSLCPRRPRAGCSVVTGNPPQITSC